MRLNLLVFIIFYQNKLINQTLQWNICILFQWIIVLTCINDLHWVFIIFISTRYISVKRKELKVVKMRNTLLCILLGIVILETLIGILFFFVFYVWKILLTFFFRTRCVRFDRFKETNKRQRERREKRQKGPRWKRGRCWL